jgi:hypothetical protein
MPNGFGVSRGGKPLVAEQRLLDRMPPPGAGGSKLLEAGIAGVRALAAGAGVNVPAPPPARSAGSSHLLVWAAAGVVSAVLLAGGALLALRRRR